MKLITRKRLIETVAERFKSHCFYQDYDGEWKWVIVNGKNAENIHKKLLRLSKTATEKQIVDIIGSGHIDITCDQCGQEWVEMAVSLCGCGEISQSGTCLNCLKKAISLIEGIQ